MMNVDRSLIDQRLMCTRNGSTHVDWLLLGVNTVDLELDKPKYQMSIL